MHKVSRSLLFASIVALGGLAACGDDVTVAGPGTGTGGPTTGTVVVSPNPATVAVNGTINMVADLGGEAAGQAVTWSSSSAAVATVDGSSGLVTGVAPGSVAITAKAGNFSGSASITVTGGAVSDQQNASVSIQSITKGGLQQPVQLNNVFGQIDVTLNVDPGQQNVTAVELVMIDSLTGAEKVVATQSIMPGASVASSTEGLSLSVAQANAQAAAAVAAGAPQQIVLSFNTAAFDPETGAVSFINGRKLVLARLVLATGSSQDQVASNSIAIQLNNMDGFYIVQTPLNSIADRPQPNSATSGGGLVWYQAGNGIEARTVPVMYSGRTVKSRTIQFDGVGSSETISGGAISTDTIGVGINTAYGRIRVLSAIATDGNPINLVSNMVGTPAVDHTAGAINGQPIGSNSNETIGVRLDSIRIDNVAPNPGTYSINATAPNNWVNGEYNFITSANWTGMSDVGVGLAGSFPYGAMFEYSGCGISGFATASSATGADIPECGTDLTNLAYTGRVVLTDKLGNSSTSGTTTFGVDKTPPVMTYLSKTQDSLIVRTDGDSVFHNAAFTYPAVNSTNAVFGVRYTDERSGFDTLPGNLAQRVRITRLSPQGTQCALGGVACGFVRDLGTIETADPTNRRHVVNIFGNLTDTDPGYYTYETYVVDRAGNQSAMITKKAAIDIEAPRITGITVPATMVPGSSTVAFTPTGTDSLEVITGSLALDYPTAFGVLRYPRWMFAQYDAPWNSTLSTPIGPGATFGSNGLTVPNVFIGRLEVVGAGDLPQDYGTALLKPTQVGANLYDIKLTSKWASTGDSTAAFAAGTSSLLWAPLYDTQIANGTPFFGRTTGAMVTTWAVFPAGSTGGKLAIRATGPTVSINPPFTNIVVTRMNADGEWQYVGGTLSGPVTNDQGATRFYTWTFTPASAEATVTAGDLFRVVGIDAAGNGLATANYTY